MTQSVGERPAQHVRTPSSGSVRRAWWLGFLLFPASLLLSVVAHLWLAGSPG